MAGCDVGAVVRDDADRATRTQPSGGLAEDQALLGARRLQIRDEREVDRLRGLPVERIGTDEGDRVVDVTLIGQAPCLRQADD